MHRAMRVLAVDPGFDRLGIAVVEGDPSKPILVHSTCVQPPKNNHSIRLADVFLAITEAIQKYEPDVLAIETLFFSTNKKTAIKVAEARGAILSASGCKQIPVQEHSPQSIKLAVTGYGSADKKAVMAMVPKLIKLSEKKRLDDEYDAIALGISALSNRYPQEGY